jgi:hypothetical protein
MRQPASFSNCLNLCHLKIAAAQYQPHMLVDQDRLSVVAGAAVLLYEEEDLGPGRLVVPLKVARKPGLPQDPARHAVQPVHLPVLRHSHHHLPQPEPVRRVRSPAARLPGQP